MKTIESQIKAQLYQASTELERKALLLRESIQAGNYEESKRLSLDMISLSQRANKLSTFAELELV